MECQDVQDSIWCKEWTEEVREHLRTCGSCQTERDLLENIGTLMKRKTLLQKLYAALGWNR